MSGKISGVPNSPPASPAASAAGARGAAVATSSQASAGAGNAGSGSGTDSVQITDTASYLVTAEQTLADVPVINAGRVAETSDALASGSYRVSPERIANQLLQFERLLPEDADE